MKWLKQLSQAIDYIENNLTDVISYEEAAKTACCSTFYFQRIFSYVAGISLSEYIRRRRMTAAAFDLQSSDMKVMDMGLKYGYESPTAFNRAFQSVHGIAPTAAREKGAKLNAYPPIKFSISVTGGESMSYRIEAKEAMRIVGTRIALKEEMEENQQIVPVFWNDILNSRLFSKICSFVNQKPNGILGITAFKDTQHIYYYIGASTDKPIVDGMFELFIPAAIWVVFESNGYFKESIQVIFKRFLTEWLPASGYDYAELPDIEVYPINSHGEKEGHAEVWIAIKKEGEKNNEV